MKLHTYESPNRLDLGDLGVHTVTYTVRILKDRWQHTTSVTLIRASVRVWRDDKVFEIDVAALLHESPELVTEIEDEVHRDFEMQCLTSHDEVGT